MILIVYIDGVVTPELIILIINVFQSVFLILDMSQKVIVLMLVAQLLLLIIQPLQVDQLALREDHLLPRLDQPAPLEIQLAQLEIQPAQLVDHLAQPVDQLVQLEIQLQQRQTVYHHATLEIVKHVLMGCVSQLALMGLHVVMVNVVTIYAVIISAVEQDKFAVVVNAVMIQ